MWLLIAFFFEHNVLKASIGWQVQRLTDSKEAKPKCCFRNTLFGEAGKRLPQHFTLLRQRRSNLILVSYFIVLLVLLRPLHSRWFFVGKMLELQWDNLKTIKTRITKYWLLSKKNKNKTKLQNSKFSYYLKEGSDYCHCIY